MIGDTLLGHIFLNSATVMMVRRFAVGSFFTNCYVVWCEQTAEAIVIDPGVDNTTEAQEMFSFIDGNKLKSKLIVNTHGHPDHTCGNGMMKTRLHSPILIHEYDAYMLGEPKHTLFGSFGFKHFSPEPDSFLQSGERISVGNASLRILHTPGHSRGSVSLYDESRIFSGDTLFAGSIGRTDFPESSKIDMKRSLEKLASLPDKLVVYPGHGLPTTISEEKRGNPFLRPRFTMSL